MRDAAAESYTELAQIEWQSTIKNRTETSKCICQNESGECLNMTDDEFMTDGEKKWKVLALCIKCVCVYELGGGM
jgi:hypothetical protein